jgi:FixJ family two-component response regulator
MRAGAVTFLQKPFRPQEFLDAVKTLFQLATEQHAKIRLATSSREIQALLSQRELQVLRLLLDGHTSKEIARELTISHKTVDVHRSNLIRKIGVRSLSQLLKIFDSTPF